ncbi:hypothetical protein OHD62_17405 [Mesorhizobium sp. YC-39]|uniref:hypothetical protein n=1 Tax=unclassified Mesorhizobium TaxID=325217 RepID=UPI0021E90602|nr:MULTISPECIES: hypothetical protein [unclassified Mesorhizobium]MCV3209621.1 hypothetical protein [Mesorhizobium sp. YC-2]MCV3230151.1 hypothetical protein [Mesorhizobium sp. YC-39]
MTVAVSRRTVTPPALHIALPGALAEEVRDLAERRGDHAPAMVAALMRRLIDGEMIDSLLAPLADAPEPEPVGQGRMTFQNVPGTLTELQCGVIYVLGFHAEQDGVFRMPATKIGMILGKSSEKHVATILPVLEARELVECVGGRKDVVLGGPTVRHWKLTWRGQSVFRQLTEERE